jgi:hypothetical protein
MRHLDSTPLPLDLSKLPSHLRPMRRETATPGDNVRIVPENNDRGTYGTAWGDYIAQYEGKEL